MCTNLCPLTTTSTPHVCLASFIQRHVSLPDAITTVKTQLKTCNVLRTSFQLLMCAKRLTKLSQSRWRRSVVRWAAKPWHSERYGKASGAALIEQNGTARTAGSGLGQRRARARTGVQVREARGRPRGGDGDHGLRGAPPGEPEYHVRRRLPTWPGKTAEPPAVGGTRRGTRPRPISKRKNSWNRQQHTPQKRHGPGKRNARRRKTGNSRRERQELGDKVQSERTVSGQQARICRALRFQISRVMLA